MHQSDERISESKFLISPLQVDSMLAWLEHICVPDPQFPHNRIGTIYYDTRDLSAFEDSRNGITTRSKYRLRWYESPSRKPSPRVSCYLEIKRKVGGGRSKERHEVELPRSILVDDPLRVATKRWRLSKVLDESPLSPNVSMDPIIAIKYDRRRYIELESRIRISVDVEIECESVNDELLPNLGISSLPHCVLEVKGEIAEFPRSLLPMAPIMEKTSYSKYVRGLEQASLIHQERII